MADETGAPPELQLQHLHETVTASQKAKLNSVEKGSASFTREIGIIGRDESMRAVTVDVDNQKVYIFPGAYEPQPFKYHHKAGDYRESPSLPGAQERFRGTQEAIERQAKELLRGHAFSISSNVEPDGKRTDPSMPSSSDELKTEWRSKTAIVAGLERMQGTQTIEVSDAKTIYATPILHEDPDINLGPLRLVVESNFQQMKSGPKEIAVARWVPDNELPTKIEAVAQAEVPSSQSTN